MLLQPLNGARPLGLVGKLIDEAIWRQASAQNDHQLGQDRDRDLGRGLGADVDARRGVQLGGELGRQLERRRARPSRASVLATNATYGTPADSAAVSTSSSSLPCEATTTAVAPLCSSDRSPARGSQTS